MSRLAVATLMLLTMLSGLGCKSDKSGAQSGDAPANALTVNGGAGDGRYAAGVAVNITADAPASGKFFDAWTGSVSGIADVNAATTTITMPAADAEITATYADVVDGLVSRFTFDIDGSDSYGTNDGALSGASVTDDGTRGLVLSLDGADDYVDLPADGMAAGRGELTLTMWICPDEWVSTNTIYDEYNRVWWQFTITENGWYTRDSSTGLEGRRDNDLAMPRVRVGEWHHLAFVYSVTGGTKTLYYDGVAHGLTSISVNELTGRRTAAQVGRPSDGHYYDGLVDDLRLYDRALSVTEIAMLASRPTYALTVNGGTGDGGYGQSLVIGVAADTSISGREFLAWVGDTVNIADTGSPATTITMPGSSVEITATYTDATFHTLAVNNGSGDGRYQRHWVIGIDADAAPSGQTFDKWIGDTSGVANVGEARTTLTMAKSDAAVTATYVDPAAMPPEISRIFSKYGQQDEVREFGQRLSLVDEVAARITGQIEQAMSVAVSQMLGRISPELGLTGPGAGRRRPASPLEIYMELKHRASAPLPEPTIPEKDLTLLREYYDFCVRNAMDSVIGLCTTAAAADEQAKQKVMELCLTLSFLHIPDSQWSSREIGLLPGWMKRLRWLKRAERYAIDVGRPLTVAELAQYGKDWWHGRIPMYLTRLAGQFRRERDLPRERVCLAAVADMRAKGGGDTLPTSLSLASTYDKGGNPRLAAMTVKSAMEANPASSSWHQAAVAHLKYLYASEQFDSVIQEGKGYQQDPRCRSVLPKVIYILWATYQQQNDMPSADRLQKVFLAEFPDSLVCADMHFASAMAALAKGDHQEAARLLEIIELRYPQSKISSKARTILENLDEATSGGMAR